MTPIRIELLGKMRFTYGQDLLTSINTNRMRTLLAYLVLHADAAQTREHLAFLLWPESNEGQARTNLRQLLHNLRRALPLDCSLLVTDNHSVRWKPDNSCAIDVIEFEEAVQAAAAVKEGDPQARLRALEAAARVYQDDLLVDLYDDWLEVKRAQLRQQLAEVLGSLAALLENLGEYETAIRYCTRLVSLDPLREAYYQTLIRLHVRNRDRSSALRVYHQCMRNLQRELGVSPGKAIQELFAEAMKCEDSPGAPVEQPPYATNLPSQMVGRKAEWESLLGKLRSVAEGRSHLALIMGEPGIGKSRLAEEVFEACSPMSGWARARSRSYFAQGQLAYGPVTELLRAQPMQAARSHLPRPQLAELARVLPDVLVENPDIPPLQPLTESWQRLHLHEAINAVFLKSSKPLLLIIDDLQWCDRDSFEWLHSLFRCEPAKRILVVGTVRIEETDRDHPLANLVREVRQSGRLSEILLAPLSADETAALATQIAALDCDPSFLDGLYNTTRGNPLFVVECVRASQEDRASRNEVPPRVQAVIGARFAQLSSAAYELAGLAAIIGRPFSFELLAKATDWDEDSLSRALEELWQRRIIDGQGAISFNFTHDLLREVAHTELSPIRRRSMHKRVGRALEEVHAPDLTGVSGRLAAHYDAAGMAEQAIRFYLVAASVARQRFADTEAADLLRRALHLCREFPESAKRDEQELNLLVTLGPSLVTTHGYSKPEVGETYERGLNLSTRSGNLRHMFALRSGSWLYSLVRGEIERSGQLAQDCVYGARSDGNQAQEMASHFLLGTSLFHLGQLAESWDQIELAGSFSHISSDPALALFAGPDVGIFCRIYAAQLLCQFGHQESAIAKSEEALVRAQELSHPFTLGIVMVYSAMLNIYRGESNLTLEHAEEASRICTKHGFAYYLALAEIFAGWATAAGGKTAAGIARLRHGLEALRATGAELRLPFYYGLLAESLRLGDQIGEAMASVASGFAFLSKNGEMWAAAELHRIHGDLLKHRGDTSQARISYQRAVEGAQQTGASLFEMKATGSLGQL